jgi:hypothetical protein
MQGGVSPMLRTVTGGVDLQQWVDGSGNVLGGIQSGGAVYFRRVEQALAVNGAVTIDARS